MGVCILNQVRLQQDATSPFSLLQTALLMALSAHLPGVGYVCLPAPPRAALPISLLEEAMNRAAACC